MTTATRRNGAGKPAAKGKGKGAAKNSRRSTKGGRNGRKVAGSTQASGASNGKGEGLPANTKASAAPAPARPAAAATRPRPPALTVSLNLPVEFGNVSIGDGTARVGVKFDPATLNVTAAFDLLCGRRIDIRAILVPKGQDAGQGTLPGMQANPQHEIRATADVKRFGVSPKSVSAGLTFALEGLDIGELGHFAKRSGRLIVLGVQEIPEDTPGQVASSEGQGDLFDEDEDEDRDDADEDSEFDDEDDEDEDAELNSNGPRADDLDDDP